MDDISKRVSIPNQQRDQFVAESAAMKKIVRLITRASWSDVTVLIHGESGTGKEVIARTIHNTSPRAKSGPPVIINCGAIPEQLIESELFGYEAGAFTGAASKGKPGFFELANKGTLVLDEIGELPVSQQVKLLRALQNHECYRVGGTVPIQFDVRVIAITNRNLVSMLEQGSFRQDLYYRLNILSIDVPPLRERKDDILPLATYFLGKNNSKYHISKRFSEDCISLLCSYHWYGNVRELQNVIEKACILVDAPIITAVDLQPFLQNEAIVDEDTPSIVISRILPLQEARKQVETELITRALNETDSIRKAADRLGVDHATLMRKIKKYGIPSHTIIDN